MSKRNPQAYALDTFRIVFGWMGFLAAQPDTDRCWVPPLKPMKSGYVYATVAGRKKYAHRIAYEVMVGPIPNDKELDHLCRNRSCCNPWHTEAVTSRLNSRRGKNCKGPQFAPPKIAWSPVTHCRHGHEYSEENVRTWRGKRACIACGRRRSRESIQRARAALRAARLDKPRRADTIDPERSIASSIEDDLTHAFLIARAQEPDREGR